MMAPNLEERIWIGAPVGRDAPLLQARLTEAGLLCTVISANVPLALDHGIGALLLTEEALSPALLQALQVGLDPEPEWSNVPIVLLVDPATRFQARAILSAALGASKSLTLLERPVAPRLLIEVMQAVLRMRQRQYQVRTLLQQLAQQNTSLAQEVAERQAIEVALRRSEAKFAQAFNASPLVITLSQVQDGRLVEVNETFVQMTGYTRAEVLGYTIGELGLWVEPRQRAIGLAQLQAGQAVRNREARFRMKDGRECTCLVSAELIELHGQPCVLTVLTDITERKQAEESLRQAHVAAEQAALRMSRLQTFTAKLSATLTYAQVGQVLSAEVLPVAGASGALLAVLNATSSTFQVVAQSGLGAEQVRPWQHFPATPGLPMADAVQQLELVLLPDHERVLACYPTFMPTQTPHQAWAIIPCLLDQRAVGALSLSFATVQAFPPEECTLLLALGRLCAQALERARLYEAEQQARARAARLQQVAERLSKALTPAEVADVILHQGVGLLGAAAASVLLVTDDGQQLIRITSVGYSTQVTEQFPHYSLATETPVTEAARRSEAVWLSSAAAYQARYPQLAEVITAIAYEAAAALPLKYEGQVIGVLAMSFPQVIDFDAEVQGFILHLATQCAQALERARLYQLEQQARVELERRVQERTVELTKRLRELDDFAYVTSHDLKAPLRAIDHLAHWISDDAAALLPPNSREHLTKLRGRIVRMERLLDDLLAYSRADRYQYATEPVDVGPLLDGIVRLVTPPQGFTVHFPRVLPVMRTQKVPLETVLRNLISNAIKHHDRADGQVQVTVRDLGAFLEFSVQDDGPGIAPAFHERIFQLFQTLKPRDTVEGSGMGLAIVKKLIESRGGNIMVESNVGYGATFRFTWPIG